MHNIGNDFKMFRTLVVQININYFFNDIPEPPVQTSGGSLDFGIHCGLARQAECWRRRTARKILATASPIWTLGKNTGRVGVGHINCEGGREQPLSSVSLSQSTEVSVTLIGDFQLIPPSTFIMRTIIALGESEWVYGMR